MNKIDYSFLGCVCVFVCVCSFVLGFIVAVYFLGLTTSLWALMEVVLLGNSVLLPSEQEDQIPVFLVLLCHLVVVGGRPVAWDTLQFWACCLPDLPECGRAQGETLPVGLLLETGQEWRGA